MPWTDKDAKTYKKGLTAKQSKTWAAVANSALKRALAKGMKKAEAEASAIKQANAVAAEMAEVLFTIDSYTGMIRNAFYTIFDPPTVDGDSRGYAFWCRDIFMDHPTLGDALIVEARGGRLYAVSFEMSDAGEIDFAARDQWQEVRLTYEPVEAEAPVEEPAGDAAAEELAELEPQSIEIREVIPGSALRLLEEKPSENRRAPLELEIVIIEPGFGNAKDGHYYSREMLAANAPAFVGDKMYTTDHRPNEKSVLTEVSEIRAIAGFTESGAPIGRVMVYHPDFCELVRNRAEAGALQTLENSILHPGTARRGLVEGKKAMIVEAIAPGGNVDWVTRAGAGGRALSLVESTAGGSDTADDDDPDPAADPTSVPVAEAGGQPEPVLLSEETQSPAPLAPSEVTAALKLTSLPEAARVRLAEAAYPNAAALTGAIGREVAYLKEITGSGRVTGLGASSPAAGPAAMTEAEYSAGINDILARHGVAIKNN